MPDARAVSRPEVRTSDADLQRNALRLVAELRGFVRAQQEASAEEPWPGNVPDGADQEERRRLWHEAAQRVAAAADGWATEYERQFQQVAIAIRDEMTSRLRDAQVGDRPWVYAQPANALGVAEVADDLERLARTLVPNRTAS